MYQDIGDCVLMALHPLQSLAFTITHLLMEKLVSQLSPFGLVILIGNNFFYVR